MIQTKKFLPELFIVFALYLCSLVIVFEKKVTIITLVYIFLLLLFYKHFLKDTNKIIGFKYLEKLSVYIFLVFLFAFTYLLQNYFLNYETITWDVPSYLVASQEIGRGNLPLETQWESKGPLLMYIYYFITKLADKNYIIFRLINDIFIAGSACLIFFNIYKKSNKNMAISSVASVIFLLITSHEWYVSEFSEIYCLFLLGIIYYIFNFDNLSKIKYILIGILFSLLTLINQGTVVFLVPYLIAILQIKDSKEVFKNYLYMFLGFSLPHLFFIYLYFINDLINVYISNYFTIPLEYTNSNASSFYELSVILRRFFQFEQFLYYSIVGILIFSAIQFIKSLRHKFLLNILDIDYLNVLAALAFYFIAGHNYAHHLYYFIFFIPFLILKLNYSQVRILCCFVFISFFTILLKLGPTSVDNLTSINDLYEDYPLKNLALEIENNFISDFDVLALDYVLVLFYLDVPNVSYIIHPGNHYEDFIVKELLRLEKLQTNEFSHISYYIELEPDVIMCNPTYIISGEAKKRDFYNCAVDDYKKNYLKLDTKKFKNNKNLHLYNNPYESIDVYLKKSE